MALDAELFLVFFVLAIIYSCFFAYTVIRALGFKNFLVRWKHAKLLYIFQLAEIFFRMLSFWLICFFDSQINLNDANIGFLLLSLPEALFISSYFMLFWVMITANIYTRLNSDSSYDYKLNPGRYRLQIVGKLTLTLLAILMVFEGVMYILLFCSVIEPTYIVLQQCIQAFITAIIVIVGLLRVQCKYSGVPYKNEKSAQFMKVVIFSTLVWTAGRITHGILYIFRRRDLERESSDLSSLNLNDMVPTIVFIVDLLVTELICFYLVLDSSFYKLFSYEEELSASLPLINKSGAPLPLDSTVTQSFGSNQNSVLELNLGFISTDEIIIQDSLSEKPGKLGKLYRGIVKNIPVVIRRIVLPRTNKYVIENIKHDIEKMTELECPHFMPVRAAAIDGNTIDLITQYIPNGSLYSVLHERSVLFEFYDKLRISREIAFAIRFLHEQGLVHGHLTSQNILLDSEWRVLISDVGLDHLKKFAGLVDKYCNKGSWSSPELLKDEKNPVAVKAQASDDSYSYGMILWEIMTMQVPFPDFTIKKLKQMIVEDGFRPAIPEKMNDGIKELMKSCWNVDPARRPDFNLIFSTLCNIETNYKGA
ncbi:unnamed protein product [Blepharisma stoltei]|uniref:Protein kinase domain-containing protein n=1 Tax=Blepharisma stoltei TaxID=1481888 RepID=A0AAU9I9D1_9CILI|nr:unnamed protein product [Blepharisma stoltei]